MQRLSHIAPLYARTLDRDICPYILCEIRQIVAERQSEDVLVVFLCADGSRDQQLKSLSLFSRIAAIHEFYHSTIEPKAQDMNRRGREIRLSSGIFGAVESFSTPCSKDRGG